jgi:flagellar hook-associated protein 1 FlgK
MEQTAVSDLLSLGASGIRSYQRALAVVSNNIANAENPDYVRRRLNIAEMSNTSGVMPLYLAKSRVNGTLANGMARSIDPFLEQNARLTGAALVGAETRLRWSNQIESDLGAGDNDVGAALATAFANGERLAAAPFDTSLRMVFLDGLSQAANSFRTTAANLSQTADHIAQAAFASVAATNTALSSLAEVNAGLASTQPGSAQQMTLLDQRDALITEISEQLDADVRFTGNGEAQIALGGERLVDGQEAFPLSIATDSEGRLTLALNGVPIAAPSDGKLSALIASAGTLADQHAALDTLAQQWGGAINDWHAAGVTDTGQTGVPLIDLSAGIAGLRLLTQEPAALALGRAGTANQNILDLANVRTASGAEQGWQAIIGTQGLLVAAQQSEVASSAAQYQAAKQARDGLSSVDLDQEAADLLRMQAAYDASARVIQVARETLQSLFSIF